MARERRSRAGGNIKELTLRGIILGAVITVIFTAANVYLGLKIGLTFATSIPAAVISMAVLKAFRDSTIQENNIVQTIASAAGTLSAIIFVLPGLVMVGWWTGFPYWLSVAVIGVGGILGVMYSVPLRRALVTGTDLPYPEGVAAAEVLKVGAGVGGAEENRRGLVMIIWSSIAPPAISLLAAMGWSPARRRRASASVGRRDPGFRQPVARADRRRPSRRPGRRHRDVRRPADQLGLSRSPLHLARGAMPLGTSLDDFVGDVFVQQGALHRRRHDRRRRDLDVAQDHRADHHGYPRRARRQRASARPGAAKRFRSPSATFRSASSPRSILVSMIPIGLLLYAFASTNPIAANPTATIVLSIIYILIAGVVIAAVCGYMAGLIGASNSPISGVGILSVVGIALILALLFPHASGDARSRWSPSPCS